ncbi:Di-copper centre-containing protein, partial [Basidiobolus meristosporus CBS 931.73]
MLAKFIPVGLTLLCAFSNLQVNAQACKTIYTRKEIREISRREWDDFVAAIKAIHSGPPPTTYDKLVAVHLQYVPSAHSNPLFFPWHRRFMKEFEVALQKTNPNVIVPYWDWTIDSQAPEQSILFRPDYFGASGDTECIVDGPFRNWNMAVPQAHCLKRRWNKGKQIGALYPPELLAKICAQSRSFQEFRVAIEAAPHALVHANIGGDGGDVSTMWSPNDPIFWVHHAYVDKIWAYFQKLRPDIGMIYEGINNENRTVDPNDMIEPFGVTVKD